ncbi:MAG: DNA mismatch endonuclease Vsr [Desulfobacteraceae bacterium]|nr:DNA mismatch endonuclease Vsr [Desulfobacteraceae bacterium]
MVDRVSPEKRSWIMSHIRSKNTIPEKTVRSLLHRMGFRFSLHRSDLPGKPDIVLPKYAAVVFVNGCFWHHHRGCKEATIPKSNISFWEQKLTSNVQRDKKHRKELRKMGWKVIVVWECELKKQEKLSKRLKKALPLTPKH